MTRADLPLHRQCCVLTVAQEFEAWLACLHPHSTTRQAEPALPYHDARAQAPQAPRARRAARQAAKARVLRAAEAALPVQAKRFLATATFDALALAFVQHAAARFEASTLVQVGGRPLARARRALP